MKIEKRGKYAGVKVHLEPEECKPFISLFEDHQKAGVSKGGMQAGVPGTTTYSTNPTYISLAVSLGKKISKMLQEYPSLMSPRTEAEIAAELLEEKKAAEKKLAALNAGKDWKAEKIKISAVPYFELPLHSTFSMIEDPIGVLYVKRGPEVAQTAGTNGDVWIHVPSLETVLHHQ